MIATEAQVTFCGHIHKPGLYSMSVTAKMTSFVPIAGVPVQLLRALRMGSPRAGQYRQDIACSSG